jgi:AcrR family transcriptional regulator
MVVESPHLRADAQRNLERILEAARAVFAEQGQEACVADVAARAGVGTATIFRRFPTKDDLVAAVLERELEEINARAAAAAGSEDPAAAIGEFMLWAVGTFIDDRCLCEATGGELFTRPEMAELVGQVTASVELLVQRAQGAGAIREDVVAQDIGFLLHAIGQAGLTLERTAPGAWRRYVGIALDGLRPEGATRLTAAPPTPEQLHDAKTVAAAARPPRS